MGVGRESSGKGLDPECVAGVLARVMRDWVTCGRKVGGQRGGKAQ